MDGIMKYLGVVVIGRNEGSRLGDCLDSFPDLWSRTFMSIPVPPIVVCRLPAAGG